MTTLAERLAAAASATFTEEARAAVEEGASRIACLELEVAQWRDMHDVQLQTHWQDMHYRRQLEQRVKALEAQHGTDKP